MYGATAGGVCAAVAAARAGCSVLLLEPGHHVGGMTTGGLGWTDLGDERVLGGMAAEFRRAWSERYGVPAGRYAGPEPHVAEEVLTRWLEESGVDVAFAGTCTAVDMSGPAIEAVIDADGGRHHAQVFVDAGYEGDLMAAAGVDHAVGREDGDLYGESLAGRQEIMPGRHNFPFGISPFADDPSGHRPGSVLPGIRDVALAPVGRGDGGVMSYGYRVCLTQSPHRGEIVRREGYDPGYFELARRLIRHYERTGFEFDAGWLVGLTPNLPGGKCDGNSLGPYSLSVLDGSAWAYPEADRATRAAITAHHLAHAQDFLWFLGHDDAVPRRVREELLTWGLPLDDFPDTGGWPHQLYVREARRMIGEVVLTQSDLQAPTRWDDPIAMGSYHIDIREVQRTWRWAWEHPDPQAHVVTEGYLSVAVPPYQIPYRALLPRRDQCTNLLVPTCLSSSAVAFASIRMEPQYQMLGHAAGVAAALAVRAGRGVHEVRRDALLSRLRDAGQVLSVG